MKCHAHVHRIRKKAKPSTVPFPSQSDPPTTRLSGGDGPADASTTLPGRQVLVTASNSIRLLNNLVTLRQDQLDVAGVRHVGVDLYTMLGHDNTRAYCGVGGCLTRPWARYVRRRCLGAWLTWMCLTIKLLVSRPLASALDSAFLRRVRRNWADLTGHRARETPQALPIIQLLISIPSSHPVPVVSVLAVS